MLKALSSPSPDVSAHINRRKKKMGGGIGD